MFLKLFNFKRFNFTLILVLVFSVLSIGSVSASGPEPVNVAVGQETCPSTGDWTKIETSGEPLSYTVNAPAGKLIVETCYKASTSVVYDGPFSPGRESYTFNSEVKNSNDQTQALSHVSYRTVDVQYASATAAVEACSGGYTSEPVNLSVTGATMTITGPQSLTLTSGQSLLAENWPIGTYSITYVMDAGYSDPGNLPSGFNIAECSQKQDAEAEAKVEACVEGATSTPVSLSVTGATMNITGPKSYTLSSGSNELVKDWPVGTYAISYVMDEGYQDPGNLPSGFSIEDCTEKENADASATVEACVEGSKSTPVVLWVEGATMHVTLDGDAEFAMDHSGGSSTYKNLEPGTYHITYTFNEGHKDPSTLPTGFVIAECEKDKDFADLSVTVKCVYDPNNTCHRWTVSNPNDFPVDFEWSTGANGGSYTESGSGTVAALGIFEFNTSYISQTMVVSYSDGEVVQVVNVDTGVCTTNNEDPDEPAGGSGPSLIATLTPALLLISGAAVAWILIKHKVKNM